MSRTLPTTTCIRITILVSGKEPATTSLVEYIDGRFGIFRGGEPVGEKWAADRLTDCVDEYQRLTKPGKMK